MLLTVAVATLASLPAADDPAALLPADTLLYMGGVSITDGAAPQTAVDRILGEAEVEAFFEEPLAILDRAISTAISESGFEAQGMSVKGMMDGGGEPRVRRWFLGLTHFEMPDPAAAEAVPMPDVGFVVGAEVVDAADLELISALWDQIPFAAVTASHGGREYRAKALEFEPGAPAPSVYLAFADNMAVVTLSERTLHGVLDRLGGSSDSLASSADYTSVLTAAGGAPAGSSTSFMRVGGLSNVFRTAITIGMMMDGDVQGATAAGKIFDLLGLDGVEYIASVASVDANGLIHNTGVSSMSPDAGGLVPSMLGQATPIDRSRLDAVPGNVLTATVSAASGSAEFYDAIMEVLDIVENDIGEDMSEVRGLLAAAAGDADLRNDLFANLTGTFVSYSIPGSGFMGQPSNIIQVDVKDAGKFIHVLENVASFAGGMMGAPIDIVASESGARTIHEIDLSATPAAMMMMQPAFSFEGTTMTLCMNSKQALEDVLAGEAGDGRLVDDPEFSAFIDALASKGDITSLYWSDNAEQFGLMYGQLAFMGSMAAGGSDLPVDLAKLPSEQAITKHLDATFGGSYAQGELLVSETVSLFQMSDMLRIVAPVAGVYALEQMGFDTSAPAPDVDPRELALSDLGKLKAGLTVYKISQGGYPASLDDLVVPLPNYPQGALGRLELPVDPWGNAYNFRIDGRKARVWSPGPNGVDEGGEGDDIVK